MEFVLSIYTAGDLFGFQGFDYRVNAIKKVIATFLNFKTLVEGLGYLFERLFECGLGSKRDICPHQNTDVFGAGPFIPE